MLIDEVWMSSRHRGFRELVFKEHAQHLDVRTPIDPSSLPTVFCLLLIGAPAGIRTPNLPEPTDYRTAGARTSLVLHLSASRVHAMQAIASNLRPMRLGAHFRKNSCNSEDSSICRKNTFQQYALFQMALVTCIGSSMRIVSHHHNRLVQLTIERREDV